MVLMYKLGVLLLCMFMLHSCAKTVDHKGKTPLVSVGDGYLYLEDLLSAMPVDCHGTDSVRFADDYIRNWVEDALLFNKAEGNIPDNEKVENLVSSYRRALIMHMYQEQLVNQNLGNEIADTEVEAYYQQNQAVFRADQPYIQGLFIKVPLNTPQLNNLRIWYKKNTQDALDKIEKFSIGNAVSYDYFYDVWKPVSDYAVKLPLNTIGDDTDYLNRNRNVELRDSAFYYFLHVEKIIPKGDPLPIEYAKSDIKEILINQKRVDFINRMKDDLYRNASENKEIIYY
ncbi:peptidylprolyl isomerase [uncultured Bacteroides sp.]|uniref:peptidylprolyl isomerase n=1 Tax=uncultured Bacteroides sp. TaxID=162156 RepID=UPI002604903F|nr:peptidylprolyl isomerase [uncultured Bacteroides sp.]